MQMKTRKTISSVQFGKLALLGLLMAIWAVSVHAQSDPYLEHFSLAKDDSHVLINWVTRPGNTCDGVDVMRSTDSVNYAVIHHFGGICGGPTTSISYSYVDEHPVANFRNYYRLALGNVGTSSVRSVDVVELGKEGIQIRPNPVIDVSKVYFENARSERCHLSLINGVGVVVGTWETQTEFFLLDAQAFQPGMYFL